MFTSREKSLACCLHSVYFKNVHRRTSLALLKTYLDLRCAACSVLQVLLSLENVRYCLGARYSAMTFYSKGQSFPRNSLKRHFTSDNPRHTVARFYGFYSRFFTSVINFYELENILCALTSRLCLADRFWDKYRLIRLKTQCIVSQTSTCGPMIRLSSSRGQPFQFVQLKKLQYLENLT